MTDRITLRALSQVLSEGFNLDELRDLCFQLGKIDTDELGDKKTPFINDLLDHLNRRNRIDELLTWGRENRDDRDWPQPPAQRLKALKQAIGRQESDAIDEIFLDLIAYLKRLEKQGIAEADEKLLSALEAFGEGDIPDRKLVTLWHKEQTRQQQSAGPDLDYADLADRLRHGEIVLFLGARCPPTVIDGLAQAASYDDFQGSFSEICEYIQSDSRRTLLRKVSDIQGEDRSDGDKQQQALYQLLADRVSHPLLLISATYDDQLEQAFASHNRPFKVLSHSQDDGDGAAGNILVRDGIKGAARPCTAEQLSDLAPLENGSSLIYKIRGGFSFADGTPVADTLTLSERDYFRFARDFDRRLPDYLARQLKGRSLWYFGHYPDGWEDRLLIQAIQDKQPSRSLAIQAGPDAFAESWWKARKVDLCRLEPGDFITQLAEQLNA